ncbi:DUF1540 domain-containing protein [Paenibacillus sp. SC116]|uniref:DUF1540 domain-containing protein n=1 Tax=Paenibacillus sp. SC116 TaxID=2968986 RepID=UPI00215AD054|nr:DUF1540 domain-containing protein [Paenibacillus sp. SC116]MCR8845777.1 DUF1540 domain-containing protein [Paenibacillus sp. SC116]
MSVQPTVRCTVANCTFWGDGNMCNADSIQIDIDAHSHKSSKEEYADELGVLHQDHASESSVTCCLTFKPKTS